MYEMNTKCSVTPKMSPSKRGRLPLQSCAAELALVVLLETLTCHSHPSLFLVTEYQIAEQVWATAHTHTLSMLKVYAIICASPKCVLLNVHAQSVCHDMCKLKVCFIKCACSKCVRHYLVHNDVLHIHPQLWFCDLKIHTCHLLVKRCQCTTSFFRTSVQNQGGGVGGIVFLICCLNCKNLP